MEYGTRVSTKNVVKKEKTRFDADNGCVWLTAWSVVAQEVKSGIFLGMRSLPYGVSSGFGGPYHERFKPRVYKTVALVSPDGKRNPVYVDPKDLQVSL